MKSDKNGALGPKGRLYKVKRLKDCPLLYYFVDEATKMAQIIAKRVTLHFGTDFACLYSVVTNIKPHNGI